MESDATVQAEFVGQIARHQAALHAYIISLMPGVDGVDDVLQETNLVLWEKRGTFRPGTSFKAWACAIARFKVMNHRRKMARLGARLFDEALAEQLATECKAGAEEFDNRLKALNGCLGRLKDQERQLVEHRYFSGSTLEGFSKDCGRPVESPSRIPLPDSGRAQEVHRRRIDPQPAPLMTRRELEADLQDLFEGCLEGDAFGALEEELRQSADARAAYREYLHLHHALQFRSKGVDLLTVVPMNQVVERRQRRYLRNAGLAAAAVLVLAMTIMAVIMTRTPPPTLTFATSPGTDLVISHDISYQKAPSGSALAPGSRLEIHRGTVEVKFASGVRGIIRGPADLTLHRADLLHLGEGTAWFKVPPKAIGFKVSTPDLILTDLGTEFGILSKSNFLDEVHVFKGKVQVFNRNGLQKKEILEAGQARVAGPAGRWQEARLDSGPFLKKLPEIFIPQVGSGVIVMEEASTEQLAYADEVSAGDLLHGLDPVAAGWNLKNDAHPSELTDGIHGAGFDEVPGDKVQGAWTTVGATVEFQLGKGPNGTGHDITSIRSIAAWNGAGFGNQTWAVEVKPVNGEFISLGEVSYGPFKAEPLDGGGSSRVVLTGESGVLARGVEAIRFTAGAVPASVDNAFVWREIDVFGEPPGR